MTSELKVKEVELIRPKQRLQESDKKWGKDVLEHGFAILPSLLFRAQARLGLNAVQLAILCHLADYWWISDRHPYPSKGNIAERLGLSPRQIQRHLTDLEQGDFIKRVVRFAGHKGQQSNAYDLTGLVEKLKKLAPEFAEVEERRSRVAKRGGLAANPATHEKEK